MERSLGLMAGAGTLPGRAALEARRHGWRVVAFAFEEAPGLADCRRPRHPVGDHRHPGGARGPGRPAGRGRRLRRQVLEGERLLPVRPGGRGRAGPRPRRPLRRSARPDGGGHALRYGHRACSTSVSFSLRGCSPPARSPPARRRPRSGTRSARASGSPAPGRRRHRADRGARARGDGGGGGDRGNRRDHPARRPARRAGRGRGEGGGRLARLPLRHPGHRPRHARAAMAEAAPPRWPSRRDASCSSIARPSCALADAAGHRAGERRWRPLSGGPAPIMLSAGEASGDLHGGMLVPRAARRWRPGVRLVGMGGGRMAAAGDGASSSI